MAFQLGNAYGKVTLDASGVKSGVSEASSSLESLGMMGSKIGEAMTGLGEKLTLGLTLPLVAFATEGVKAAADTESAVANLNATIKSTGGVAGVSAKSVIDYAEAMQKTTMFNKDAIITGDAMLLTFTNIGKNVFPEASTAMLNMAQKFGSIQEASIQLGKALNDPIGGVTALRRVGVMLNAQQEQQIKDFMKVNDIAGAQGVILAELQKEFGGLAEAAGKTPEGKWAIFLNKMQEVAEVVGNYFIPGLLKILDVLSSLADAFLGAPTWVQVLVINLGMVLAAIGPILMILGQLIVTISTVVGAWQSLSIALPGIVTAFGSLGTVLTDIGVTLTTTVLPAIGSMVLALLPVIAVVALVAAAFGLLYWAWTTDFMGFQTTLRQLGFIIQYYFQQGMAGAQKAVEDAAPVIQKDWADMTKTLGDKWNDFMKLYVDLWKLAWTTVINVLVYAVARVVDYVTQLRDSVLKAFQIDWGQIGVNIIAGIIGGLTSQIGALVNAVQQAAQRALDAAKDELGIHSESTKFRYLGKMSALGYVNEMARNLNPDVVAGAMARATPSGAPNVSQQIVQNFATGLTLRDVNRLMDERDRALMTTLAQAFGS